MAGGPENTCPETHEITFLEKTVGKTDLTLCPPILHVKYKIWQWQCRIRTPSSITGRMTGHSELNTPTVHNFHIADHPGMTW